MQVLTHSEIKQVSGASSDNSFDAFSMISGFSALAAGIGLLAQSISYSVYDTRMPGTTSDFIVISFLKAALIPGTLGAIFGAMAFLTLQENPEENYHTSACM